jgi:methyl-accepting chemotaxis protein
MSFRQSPAAPIPLTVMTESNGHQPEKIDVLIDQVGRLTEVVTIGFNEIKTGMADLKATTERQAQVAEQQAETVRQLVGIVETLIHNQQNG